MNNDPKKQFSFTSNLDLAILLLVFLIALALVACSGCTTAPKKVRDIELKGMYVNGYSEVLAIGAGRLTSIPGEREALAAHYEEDTAWLSPSTKTHKLDIFLVGTNAVENSKAIIEAICKAFSDVAPAISSNNAAVAKGGTTTLDLMKSNAATRQEIETEKLAAKKAASAAAASSSGSVAADSSAAESTCKTCVAGDCTDCTISEDK